MTFSPLFPQSIVHPTTLWVNTILTLPGVCARMPKWSMHGRSNPQSDAIVRRGSEAEVVGARSSHESPGSQEKTKQLVEAVARITLTIQRL